MKNKILKLVKIPVQIKLNQDNKIIFKKNLQKEKNK